MGANIALETKPVAPQLVPNIGPVERAGSVLAGCALISAGMRNHAVRRYAYAALGAELLRRGISGRSLLYRGIGIRVSGDGQRDRELLGSDGKLSTLWRAPRLTAAAAVTIFRPREEVYRFCREFENMPLLMKNLESVAKLDEQRWRWIMQSHPSRSKVNIQWDTVIANEVPGRRIEWHCLRGSSAGTRAAATFEDAPGSRGTEVRIELRYTSASGTLGAAIAKVMRNDPERRIEEALIRLRQILESGETITTAGQPGGGRPRQAPVNADALVDAMSQESFPASDAPAY